MYCDLPYGVSPFSSGTKGPFTVPRGSKGSGSGLLPWRRWPQPTRQPLRQSISAGSRAADSGFRKWWCGCPGAQGLCCCWGAAQEVTSGNRVSHSGICPGWELGLGSGCGTRRGLAGPFTAGMRQRRLHGERVPERVDVLSRWVFDVEETLSSGSPGAPSSWWRRGPWMAVGSSIQPSVPRVG